MYAIRSYYVFEKAGLPMPKVEPMIRGRLVDINGKPVRPEQYPEGRAQRLAAREFNLSYSADLPKGNTVAAGHWHGNSMEPAFSVVITSYSIHYTKLYEIMMRWPLRRASPMTWSMTQGARFW